MTVMREWNDSKGCIKNVGSNSLMGNGRGLTHEKGVRI